MKNLHTFEEFLNESLLNESEGHDYSVNYKVGDTIELPIIGKCKVEEVNYQPKKVYKNPFVSSSENFTDFTMVKVNLKETHKPQHIGKNAMRLSNQFGDEILLYQYRSQNNKVYSNFIHMT